MERMRLPRRGNGGSETQPPSERPRRTSGSNDNLGTQTRYHADDALERDADSRAGQLLHGGSAHPRRTPAEPTLPDAGGRTPAPTTRALAERSLGKKADQLRIHDDASAQAMAASIGARAFADGSHIWLGPGASEHDRELIAHELGHVAQGRPGLHLRAATWLERRAWLSFFDNYLPRRFLNNYMDDTGTPITLSPADMIDCNPIVNIRRSHGFATYLRTLQATAAASGSGGKSAPASKYIEVSGPGEAMTNGTLGNFTIHYKGLLTVHPSGTWTFVGTMDFYDIWDFDPKPFGHSGRSTAGEIKTRVGAYFLPGKAFRIFSVPVPLVQSGGDRRATWAGGSPHFVNDRLGRTASDVDVGGGGGEVGGGEVGGPEGAEAGGGGGVETGTQSGEDLNR